LIDKQGRVCHSWPVGGFRLIEDGQMVTNNAGGFQIVDWNGNITWEWEKPTAAEDPRWDRAHHDYEPVYDPVTGDLKSILAVIRYKISYAEAIAAGCDPETLAGMDEFSDDENTIPNMAAATPDAVYEINMAGEVIWSWNFFDHAVQSYDPAGVTPGGRSTYVASSLMDADYDLDARYRIQDFGRLDLNLNSEGREGLDIDWNHINSMSYNPARDEIIVNSREYGEIYVIDHNTTTEEAAGPDGDFVYRWGNPANYGVGLPPSWRNNGDQQIHGAHNIHWIQEGYEGAGHLLIFENASMRHIGAGAAFSASFEINPYASDVYTSDYVRQEDAGYTGRNTAGDYGKLSNQIVWKWSTADIHRFQYGFRSGHISGTQRCKNGNTLIIAGAPGNVIEVTPEGDVVWNWINPYAGGEFKTFHGPGDTNTLFRAYPIPKDDPRLAGKDLTPGDTLTGRLPGPVSDGFQFPEPGPSPTGWGTSGLSAGEGGGGAAGGIGGGGVGGIY
jgi:arylsulfotransferase ASST